MSSDPATSTRAAAVRERVEAARRMLDEVGIGCAAPAIVLDAALPSHALAATIDAASGSTLLLSPAGEADLDVILHELVHVWMRARGPTDPEPRWRVEGGVATHESAMIHEGVADFVVAALTRDPIIAERATEPGHARSLRIAVACPDGLVGRPEHDAMVVAGALWQLADGDPRDVIAAMAHSAPCSTHSLATFVAATRDALEARSAPLAARWSELVAERGLLRCGDPITVVARATARADDFFAVGTTHFGVDHVAGPLAFRTAIDAADALDISVRSTRREPPLAVQWQAERDGVVVVRGTAPLDGWPSQHTRLTLAVPTDTLTFRFLNAGPDDVGFNDISVTRVVVPTRPPTSGCEAIPIDSGLLAMLVAWVLWRRRT